MPTSEDWIESIERELESVTDEVRAEALKIELAFHRGEQGNTAAAPAPEQAVVQTPAETVVQAPVETTAAAPAPASDFATAPAAPAPVVEDATQNA